jgi:hypothetical protein
VDFCAFQPSQILCEIFLQGYLDSRPEVIATFLLEFLNLGKIDRVENRCSQSFHLTNSIIERRGNSSTSQFVVSNQIDTGGALGFAPFRVRQNGSGSDEHLRPVQVQVENTGSDNAQSLSLECGEGHLSKLRVILKSMLYGNTR